MKKNKNVHNSTHGIATCCICGTKLSLSLSHNPYPVREKSWYGQKENRCCSDCNTDIVIPARLSLPHRDVLARNILIARYKNMSHVELRQAKANGSQIGNKAGSTFVTKKSKAAKEIISRHSKAFGGSLDDTEVMRLCGCSRNTYYKYKKELTSA